jgi:hypothetical protein
VTFPIPAWRDHLALSSDEIRQFGVGSVQVNRRPRAALVGLRDTITVQERREAVLQYLQHLNLSVGRSRFDDEDRSAALQVDRQGLGLARKQQEARIPASAKL